MINKIKLLYYKLMMDYYSFFINYINFSTTLGILTLKYPTVKSRDRQKLTHYTTLFLDLHYDTYPQEHVTVECLDACELPPFEEATINLRNEQAEIKKAHVAITTYL